MINFLVQGEQVCKWLGNKILTKKPLDRLFYEVDDVLLTTYKCFKISIIRIAYIYDIYFKIINNKTIILNTFSDKRC